MAHTSEMLMQITVRVIILITKVIRPCQNSTTPGNGSLSPHNFTDKMRLLKADGSTLSLIHENSPRSLTIT